MEKNNQQSGKKGSTIVRRFSNAQVFSKGYLGAAPFPLGNEQQPSKIPLEMQPTLQPPRISAS